MFCALLGQDISLAFTGPLVLWFFISNIFSHYISSASMRARVFIFLYTMRTSKCITENKAKVLRIIFALFFYFSHFLSLTPR